MLVVPITMVFVIIGVLCAMYVIDDDAAGSLIGGLDDDQPENEE